MSTTFRWGSTLPKQLDSAFAVADGHDHDGINSKAVTVGIATGLADSFTMEGGVNDITTTVTTQTVGAGALTIPDFAGVADTFVFTTLAQTLTNKTIDCDGTGNVISNVNANELDPTTIAASAQYGIPFIIPYLLTNQASDVAIFNANAPFKFQVIKAWSISTSEDGGTWKLTNGTSDITNAVTVAAAADDFDEPTDYTIANGIIAANGSLTITPDAGGALDAQIYIMCVRTDT